MAPSKGYKRLNDNAPSEVIDLDGIFHKALDSIGVCSKKTKTWFDKKELPGGAYKGKDPPCIRALEKGTLEGLRNEYGIRLASYYITFKRYSSDLSIRKLKTWNTQNTPVLKETEVISLIESVNKGKYDYGCTDNILKNLCNREQCPLLPKTTPPLINRERKSQADQLVNLCISQQPIFFHDQHKIPYIRIQQNDFNIIVPIRSRKFKMFLANLIWKKVGKVPGNEGLSSALNVLQGKALLEGEQYTLYNRVAPADDGFWIDMADHKQRAIKVDAQGWRIVDNPPILFRRYSHQLPLIEPTQNGDSWKLLRFFNLKKTDNETRLTLICACASYYIPLIPHPILVLYGIQGSGKSWLFKLIRRVFDPSSIEVLTMPRSERDRVQQLDHHWLAFYDNITSLPTWISDSLCKAATGGGFTKRELYSDDEDIIFNFKRCVGLNGINIASQRGDLLDRSLLVGLEHIPNNKRKTEAKLLAEFEEEKASILGGFLDVLVKAIPLYSTINPDRLFRMADFTRWGCAIAKALGKTPEEFITAYESKVKNQIEEAAHASPVATVLLDYLEKETGNIVDIWDGWEDTPTVLFKTLLEHAKTLNISTRQKGWPKAPNVLVRQLNELAPSLKSLGWEIVTSKSGTRKISINSVLSVQTVQNEQPKGNDLKERDDKDDVLPSSFGNFREPLEEIGIWLITNKNKNGLVDSNALAVKCKALGLDVQKIVKILRDDCKLLEVPNLGKWGG